MLHREAKDFLLFMDSKRHYGLPIQSYNFLTRRSGSQPD